MPEGQEAQAAEPSMEEILASIRKIIADDDVPANGTAAAGEDVLELTQMVEEDGSVVDLNPPAPEPEPIFEPAPVADFAPVPAFAAAPVEEPAPEPAPQPALVSQKVASTANSSLAALANMVQMERLVVEGAGSTPLGNGRRTLEDMAMEILRPLLKDWLDNNLSTIVERMVQKEIERIVGRKGD